MTLRQHEPSAHAPCTKIMVEFGGKVLVFNAEAGAVFCARATLMREPSSATPRDAAVSAPRNLRRFMSSSWLLARFEFVAPPSLRQAQGRLGRASRWPLRGRDAHATVGRMPALQGLEELFHRCCNFDDVSLDCKMPGIEKLHLRVRQVFFKSLCSGRNEEGIVLSPDRKQRRFRFTEIILEFRIKLYVRGIIQKQIELNLFAPWPFEQSRIQRV